MHNQQEYAKDMDKQNPKEIIVRILDIVGYGNGKEGFADQLLSLCQQQAIIDLNQRKNFSKEQYLETVRKATEKIISDYILTVSPKLSDTQRNNLQTYIQSIA